MSTDMMRRAGSRITEPDVPDEVTVDTSRSADVAVGYGAARTGGGADANATRRPGWWRRVWQRLMPAAEADLVIDQLNRQLAVLEGARAELEAGWVQGGWWSVGSAEGGSRLVTGYAAAGGHPDRVDGVCLVGALVRAGSQLQPGDPNAGDLNAGGSNAGGSGDARADVGRAVDAVYDALWASRGQPDTPRRGGLPPVPPPDVRLARVRTLTQWNDQAGRSQAEVVGVVDRAISATVMDLMSAPRPAGAEPALARTG